MASVPSRITANGRAERAPDCDSIMLYQFPAELFIDHEGTPLNTKLSNKDKAFIAHLYPRP